jgi:hypothetical protein
MTGRGETDYPLLCSYSCVFIVVEDIKRRSLFVYIVLRLSSPLDELTLSPPVLLSTSLTSVWRHALALTRSLIITATHRELYQISAELTFSVIIIELEHEALIKRR